MFLLFSYGCCIAIDLNTQPKTADNWDGRIKNYEHQLLQNNIARDTVKRLSQE